MKGNDIGRDGRIALVRTAEGRAGADRTLVPHPRGGDRRGLFEDLRGVAVHVATADLLERRAATATSPVLAGLLRERAAGHRRAADRMRRRAARAVQR